MSLGLSGSGAPLGEVRVGFRSGWIRGLAISVGGAGLVGLVIAVLDLAQHNPQQFFELLSRWGWVWIIALASIFVVWDFSRALAAHLGKLADSVQQSAVAINRIADKDDRERDRMQTEVAFIGRRMMALTDEQQEIHAQMKENHREVVRLIGAITKGDGAA